jgi:hypothetical protein
MSTQSKSLFGKQYPATRKLAISVGLAIALLGTGTVDAKAPPSSLVGAWKVEVQFVNCESGNPMGAPFYSLVMFHRDGTATEAPFASLAGRTPSYGTWTRTADNVFASYTQFGVMDANGAAIAYQELERMIRLSKDGQTIEVDARSQRFNLNDEPLFSVCAEAVGDRLPAPTPF